MNSLIFFNVYLLSLFFNNYIYIIKIIITEFKNYIYQKKFSGFLLGKVQLEINNKKMLLSTMKNFLKVL